MNDPVSAVSAFTATPAVRAIRPPDVGLRDTTATLGEFSTRVFGRDGGGPAEMLARLEQAALNSISPRDYVRSMLVATDLSMQVSASMMKFHVSSSLGSAATGLFNTLLRNRE